MKNCDATKFHSEHNTGSDHTPISSQNMFYGSSGVLLQHQGSDRFPFAKPIFLNDKSKQSSFRIDDLLEAPDKNLSPKNKAYVKPISANMTTQFKHQIEKLNFLNKLKSSFSNDNLMLPSNFEKNQEFDFNQSKFRLFAEMNTINKHILPNTKIDFLPLLYHSKYHNLIIICKNKFFYFIKNFSRYVQ